MIIFVSLAAPRVPVRVTLSRRDSDDISEKDLSQFLTTKVSVCYPHLQALEVFVALNCRPLCRPTAASNIKTTKIFFFVTSSLFYPHHFLCKLNTTTLDLVTITILYLSETDVYLVCFGQHPECHCHPGNIHTANCTGAGT